MTEKRYSLWKCNDYKNGVKDNSENAYYLDEEVVNLLNELADENEQLKSEIEKLSYVNEDLLKEKRIWKQMSDEYTKLSDENKQLKHEIIHLKNKLAYKDQHNNEKFKGIEDWAMGGF